MTDPVSRNGDGSDRAIVPAPAATGTAFAETELAGFAKAGLVEGEESLGAGGNTAAAPGAAPGVDPGDIAMVGFQRISSICFQVNSAGCLLMV